MLDRIKDTVNMMGNMGPRYLAFRTFFELRKKTGLLEGNFPADPDVKVYFTREQWRREGGNFFFPSRAELNFPALSHEDIKERFRLYRDGKIMLFNSFFFDFGENVNWFVNPDNGYEYPREHWTRINDYSRVSGDIKFVWERSRFSFILDIIRYDYHFDVDCSSIVFSEILSWIRSNPVNIGPNYRCSQEISIRLMNWYFCLYYYRDSTNLTDEVFRQIQYSIYWQLHHVYHNINFSRIAVRNNHAITETLALYISGMLFPFVDDFKGWSRKGKKWFEEEVRYQVYPDGTFLQFSMNYHRVVVQLLTWGIRLAQLNRSSLDPVVKERAAASLRFLQKCTNDHSGFLPNYGANDGALFFRLNSGHFRDYRSQLNALSFALDEPMAYPDLLEDAFWYGLQPGSERFGHVENGLFYFPDGGYVVIREDRHLTFLRCGTHKDRPSQADNLHLDCWVDDMNVLQDAGTYKYNTEPDMLKYFMGTESHNTVKLDDHDQMKKGSRFIWYYWTKCNMVTIDENENEYRVTARIEAFRHLGTGINHIRTIVKAKDQGKWQVCDEVTSLPAGVRMRQLWHSDPVLAERLVFLSRNRSGNALESLKKETFSSPLYGVREVAVQREFSTTESIIQTNIQFN